MVRRYAHRLAEIRQEQRTSLKETGQTFISLTLVPVVLRLPSERVSAFIATAKALVSDTALVFA